ncbi:MAG: NTP transferase domain-containing protein [Acidilobaceae archaeon]
MRCIVMAGGRGARMGGVEKPLLEPCGKPALLRVLEAAKPFCSEIAVITSPRAPITAALCPSLGVKCLSGAGDYVADLVMALSPPFPILVLPSDLPFLDSETLGRFLRLAQDLPFSVLNLVGEEGPSGISLFNSWGGEWADVNIEGEALLDMDTWEDYWRAVELCGSTEAELQKGR